MIEFPCNADGPLAAALAFLQSDAVERCGTAARGTLGPYGFKHKVEEWHANRGRRIYIPEQDLVVAAILLGIPFDRDPDRGVVIGARPTKTDARSNQSGVNNFRRALGDVSQRGLTLVATAPATSEADS